MNIELNKAFVAARLEIQNPGFDSTNPHFRSKFASLKAVVDATIEVAARHGIAVHQDLQHGDGGMLCYTHLCHVSGEERVFGPLFFPCTKQDVQGYASASTYARRYHLMSVFCIVGEEDDDGNAAASSFDNKAAKTRVRNAMLKAARENSKADLEKATKDLSNGQKAELWDSFNHDQRRLLEECRKGEDNG
jgi:hypothetical protein